MVAQVVERWHSAWAGQVRIPGRTLAFFHFRIAVNLFSLGIRLFLITLNRVVNTLSFYFLFPIIIYLCKIINFKLKMFQEKGKINPIRGREMPIFLNVSDKTTLSWLRLDKVYSSTQCPAVATHSSLMRAPPQRWVEEKPKNETRRTDT